LTLCPFLLSNSQQHSGAIRARRGWLGSYQPGGRCDENLSLTKKLIVLCAGADLSESVSYLVCRRGERGPRQDLWGRDGLREFSSDPSRLLVPDWRMVGPPYMPGRRIEIRGSRIVGTHTSTISARIGGFYPTLFLSFTHLEFHPHHRESAGPNLGRVFDWGSSFGSCAPPFTARRARAGDSSRATCAPTFQQLSLICNNDGHFRGPPNPWAPDRSHRSEIAVSTDRRRRRQDELSRF
jgi:hypothetical protein